ncbi:MAG: DUF357 domain-containing protein [Candidatus Marsarchaeota archaeon]|jgi:hypothetical protein|nr:DUF357 domain-containing protein [Candidatus Marsarchaeota archaeon]MCL5430778.1 DUF357 domain-containing protein [Candidatus Marsarchaeota archaeon]
MVEEIHVRITKDIEMFYPNASKIPAEGLSKAELHVFELSKMYASDAKSYLDKGDLYTSFSCISYAHGLLDALREILDGRNVH